jgi:hypothetical protein
LWSQIHARRTKNSASWGHIGDEIDRRRILLSSRGEFAENEIELQGASVKESKSYKYSQHRHEKLAVSEGGAFLVEDLEERGHKLVEKARRREIRLREFARKVP